MDAMQEMPEHGHAPVMVDNVLRWLDLTRAEPLAIMDCTAGRGGHAVRIAQAMAAEGGGMLIALDVDPENLKYARQRVEEGLGCEHGDEKASGVSAGKVELRTFHANFGEAGDVLAAWGWNAWTDCWRTLGSRRTSCWTRSTGCVHADLPLDMRLDPRIRKNASDLLAKLEEKELAGILQDYCAREVRLADRAENCSDAHD